MGRQKSFLLIVIPMEEPENEFCGLVKSVSTGNSYNFTNMDDFRKWMLDELAADNRFTLRQANPSFRKDPAPITPL